MSIKPFFIILDLHQLCKYVNIYFLQLYSYNNITVYSQNNKQVLATPEIK